MKHTVTLLLVLLSFQFLNAQTVQWTRKGSSPGFENGNAIATDDSGNVYVTGQIEYTAVFDNYILPSKGQHDIFVAKYNRNGSIVWIKSVGGTEGDIGWAIGIDAQHNVYIAGEVELTVQFGNGVSLTSSGGNDVFVAKYDANGNIKWARRFGDPATSDKARAMAVSPSGNCYVTGSFGNSFTFGSTTRSTNGGNDMFIVKYDSNGNPQWAKSGGGSKQDRGYGVAIDAAEYVYVAGSFVSPATFHGIALTAPGNMGAFIVKYNSSGSYQWAKGAGDCCDTTQANAITLDPSGNIYIAGQFAVKTKLGSTTLTSAGGYDMFVAKYNNSGSLQWAKKAGGAGEDIANGITCDPVAGRVFITGSVASAGSAGSLTYPFSGYKDVVVASYSTSSGSEKWIKTYGGSRRDVGLAISRCSQGIYVTGLFNGTAQFGSYTMTGYPNSYWADFLLFKILPPPPPLRESVEKEELFSSVKVYPNPFTESFTVHSDEEITIDIYDINGRLVEQKQNDIGDIIMGTSLTEGIYILSLSNGKERKTQKIIKGS